MPVSTLLLPNGILLWAPGTVALTTLSGNLLAAVAESVGSLLTHRYAHYDGEQNYNDFSPFGGWSRPSIKQYAGDASLCGLDVDLNWYP